ncbi:flagellar hook-length control protein [Pandoraea horticolens]|uniref:Flagellar hook-length control protein n=1 Tax=Pandoraea horticolens TaxID=2508298 RepID=A0A5E4S8D1_9BURK|nr:flagellar hook-length control protein FliK [Pandoraea horticolens]VVD71323.1 flagellar hook-length control protein [Pandoraea horticolens]
MIVEYSRLTTPANTDMSAPVADGALPIGPAQDVPSPAAGDVLSDFAATLGRSTVQGLELTAQENDADAAPEAAEQALKADAPERIDVAPEVGAPVVADMPEITPHLGESSMENDAARDVPVAPSVVAPAVGDSAIVAQDTPSRGIESLRDAVSPHIATLLAAHEHRMRGALGSHAPAGPGESGEPREPRDGPASAMMSSSASAVRAAFPVTIPPGVSLALGLASPSPTPLTVLPLAADPATQGVAFIDSAATQALRAAFAAGTFGNTFVGEPSTVAMPGGFPSANGTAGDGTSVARTLSERVQTMMQNGVHEARLRLTPDELGDIAIVVRKSAMQLSVSLQVARPEALSLVQGTAALLRDMLSQRHAGDVNVSVGSMPSFSGDGASGNGRERHSRDERSGDAGPGLALGEAARQREAFRL